MPSPVRRSARAAPPSASVSSSTSSNRQDRHVSTQQKSATPHSSSSGEELSGPPRRSKRAHPLGDTDAQKQAQDADEEAVEDDEEVTRCICGQQEYPGPPLSEAFSSTEAQPEDAGGLFIQCDGCSVWQHGGCVGIVDESQSPDKYYCEMCRPKQHEQHTDANGQRYSLYLPITSKFTQRKTSMSRGSDDKVKRERADTASRASADPTTGKRRGTIRSREHDEEAEQIQRAIEESTRELQGGKRNGKRSREESSDDSKQDNKRQRRVSESMPANTRAATLDEDSEDEDGDTTSKVKKARAEAAQFARQAEQREKDKEREKARAEAAGRRQERAGRRRGDDDPEEPNNATNSGSHSPPPSSQPNSPSSLAAPEKTFPRRGPGKKVKKLGNNQYTKNRGEHAAASSPHNRKRLLTSGGTSSGDEQAPTSDTVGTPLAQEAPVNGNIGRGRWGKGKKINGHAFRHITSEPMEATIPNMARNLEGMMAYIQKSQLDHADDGLRLGGGGSPTAGSPIGGDGTSAMELADQLTKGIREWQERYRPQDSVRAL